MVLFEIDIHFIDKLIKETEKGVFQWKCSGDSYVCITEKFNVLLNARTTGLIPMEVIRLMFYPTTEKTTIVDIYPVDAEWNKVNTLKTLVENTAIKETYETY